MSINEILTYLGVFVGGIFLTLAGYGKKPKPVETDPIVAGVGIELGNRLQTDQGIAELKRIADSLTSVAGSLAVLADRRQAATAHKLDEILDRLEERERRN